MRDKSNFNLVIYLFVAFILGGLLMYVIAINTDVFESLTPTQTTSTNDSTCRACSGTVIVNEGSLSASVEKAYDAVMMVRNYKNATTVQSTGSGFVYKTDSKYAYLMTNHHVIDGAAKVTLITSKDKEIEGKVLGSDEYLDLAVVRLNKSDIIDIVEIGTSEKSKLGDTVFTIGSPLGYEYRGTITDGILSGKDREVAVSLSSTNDWIMKVLQTNAAVNPGNSGGPLLNASGEVIGIISLKLVETEVENMGFAIPIEYAMSHIDSLEKGEAIVRPMLGISMINATDTYSLYRNGILLDDNVTSGVVVAEITNNSGASKSDLKKGDVITKLNGEETSNIAYLRYELYKYNVGDTITIAYLRDGKERTTKVKLTEYKN